jgi:hypothetical protein
MKSLLSLLKSHWPPVLALLVAFWAEFGTLITTWVVAHPKYATLAHVVTFVIAYYMKSPLTPKPPVQ